MPSVDNLWSGVDNLWSEVFITMEFNVEQCGESITMEFNVEQCGESPTSNLCVCLA